MQAIPVLSVTLSIASDPTFVTLLLTGLSGTVVSLAGLLWNERNKRGDVEKEKSKVDVELAVANTKLASFGKEAPEVAEEISLLRDEFRRAMGRRAHDEEHSHDQDSVYPYEDRARPPRRVRQ